MAWFSQRTCLSLFYVGPNPDIAIKTIAGAFQFCYKTDGLGKYPDLCMISPKI